MKMLILIVITELLRWPSEPLEIILESSENDRLLEENENLLNLLAEFRFSSNKKTMIAENLSVNEIEEVITVATGEKEKRHWKL